jgi:hypothetical protein
MDAENVMDAATDTSVSDRAVRELVEERLTCLQGTVASIEEHRKAIKDLNKTKIAQAGALKAVRSMTTTGGMESHALADEAETGFKRADAVKRFLTARVKS